MDFFRDLNFLPRTSASSSLLRQRKNCGHDSRAAQEQMSVRVVHGGKGRLQIISVISVIRGWFMTKFMAP